MGLGDLVTEQVRQDLVDLDLRDTAEIVRLMAAEESQVPRAVAEVASQVAAAIEAAVRRLRRGGRLVYVGAGTAGRLGVLDAAECGPTFDTDRVVAVMAGGLEAFSNPDETAEDDPRHGAADLERLHVGEADAVVGISASGRTPYVLGALERAKQLEALTIGLSCNPGSQLSQRVHHPIEVVVGPEVISGSTRLKAGTAQKLVLNMLSTVTMVRFGKTFGNLMVDVRATNEKLRDRALRIIREATGADELGAAEALEQAEGEVKVAIVMLLAGLKATQARSRLAAVGGSVRSALEER